MRDVQVEITPAKQRPGKSELSIEERVLEAARKFNSELSGDVEREVTELLEGGYRELLLKTVGIERSHWDHGLAFNTSAHTDTARELRSKAEVAARSLVESIDFGSVVLTAVQVGAIKTAYNTELKRRVADAARDLAQEDARQVAAKVLGITLE